MLKVDLGQLERRGRIRIDEMVPGGHILWERTGLQLPDGLEVTLEAQQAAADVLVRGQLRGRALLECRRCLREVRSGIDEEVTFLYRAGLSPTEAEAAEVYALPGGAREIDVADAVREHVILAVPRYPLCNEACAGICARCGADLNLGPCGCRQASVESRWAALRKNED